jgi:hypothetical protein
MIYTVISASGLMCGPIEGVDLSELSEQERNEYGWYDCEKKNTEYDHETQVLCGASLYRNGNKTTAVYGARTLPLTDPQMAEWDSTLSKVELCGGLSVSVNQLIATTNIREALETVKPELYLPCEQFNLIDNPPIDMSALMEA